MLYDLPQQLDSHLTETMKSVIRNGWRVGFHIIVVGNLPSQWEKELFIETDGPKMSAVANTPIGTASKRIEILKNGSNVIRTSKRNFHSNKNGKLNCKNNKYKKQ